MFWKSVFLTLNKNICCEYSKEPSQRDGSFEHTKYMFKQTGKINLSFYVQMWKTFSQQNTLA